MACEATLYRTGGSANSTRCLSILQNEIRMALKMCKSECTLS
jgi:hypothetical protein